MNNGKLQRMYRTHETSTSGDYITDITENPQHDLWEFTPYELRIKEADYNADGTLELSLQNGDDLFPYLLSGLHEIKTFLDDMQVLRDENAAWKGIAKLKGMTLYGIFHYPDGDFYALGIPVRRDKLPNINKLENRIDFSKLRNEIEENKKEMKEKKDVGRLTDKDYDFTSTLRKDGLVDKNYSLTEKAESLAEESVDINDLFNEPFEKDDKNF